jgi:hypothetical protein
MSLPWPDGFAEERDGSVWVWFKHFSTQHVTVSGTGWGLDDEIVDDEAGQGTVDGTQGNAAEAATIDRGPDDDMDAVAMEAEDSQAGATQSPRGRPAADVPAFGTPAVLAAIIGVSVAMAVGRRR